tara:strand:- start:28856 stop:29098 length:243 start_codon:yes stop_codon:yes gene_type:complete
MKYKNQLSELERITISIQEETTKNEVLLSSINAIMQEITDSDRCPECGSVNVSNEGPEEDDGHMEVSCHSCSYQWNSRDL